MKKDAGNTSILSCPDCSQTVKAPPHIIPCSHCGYYQGAPP